MTKQWRAGVLAEAVFVVIPAVLALAYWAVTFGG